MADFSIDHTFSNDESIEYPPPLSYGYADDTAYADGTEYGDYADNARYTDKSRYSDEQDVTMNTNPDGPSFLSYDEEENQDVFEQTMSEYQRNGEIPEYSNDEFDSSLDTDMEEEESAVSEEKRAAPLSKKKIICSAALALMVILVAIIAGTVSSSKKSNQKSAAVAESNASIVAPTDSPVKSSPAPSEQSAVSAPTEDPNPVVPSPTEDPEPTEPTSTEDPEPVVPAPTEDLEPTEPTSTGECKSILDLVCATDGLETLCGLIGTTCNLSYSDDICSALGQQGDSDFTIFAPTNEAFEALPRAILTAVEDPNVLTEILMYHAVQGKVLSDGLFCKTPVTMANMQQTTTVCKNDSLFQVGLGNSHYVLPKITATDLLACNGVVHLVDNVILPGYDHENSDGHPVAAPSKYAPTPAPNAMPSHSQPTHGGHVENPANKFPLRPIRDKVLVDDTSPDYPDAFCEPEISVSKQCYTFGESIEIKYKVCDPLEDDWFGVFRPNSCDRYGRMRQNPAYWELPCGGHGKSCANPQRSGSMIISANIGMGPFMIYGITGVARPFQSTVSSASFYVAKHCPDLPSYHD